MLVVADVAKRGDEELVTAHHCGRTGVASGVNVMAWRVGCGQAWETQTHERKTARVVPWIAESQDVTSCAADDHLRRANATLTLAGMLDLMSSDTMTRMASDQCCKGDGMMYALWAERDAGWEAVHVARARPATPL